MKKNPALFQVNTRVWMRELSADLGRQATLDDIPDAVFANLKGQGFDWIYLLSVWQTGKVGCQVSRTHPGWLEGYKADLPDVTVEDICGSGFAISDYILNSAFGGPDALARLQQRVNSCGLSLMLDHVPNHTAIDHGWVQSHPQYFVGGNEQALAWAPQNFARVGERIFAHGRDPYFDGWPDTLQLNYGNAEMRAAMVGELTKIAQWCDGLRCDMAMLILPDVFRRTWGIDIEPFWADALAAVRKVHSGFTFMAEVYWSREWELLQQGFDFTYDKEFYDRLRHCEARRIREHLCASLAYQEHCARFLENHDEPRAASIFPTDQHKAAAVLTFLSPGLRFFHQGQMEGWRRRASVHLSRRAVEEVNRDIEAFYVELLECLKLPVVHDGDWKLLECVAAWEGNGSWDSVISFIWTDSRGSQLLVVVNYAPHDSQCYVRLSELAFEGSIRFNDVLGTETYTRDPEALKREGLYIALGPWRYNAFLVEPCGQAVHDAALVD